MLLDTTFPANYEIEFDVDLPGTGGDVRRFQITSSSTLGVVAHLCRFHPESGDSWLGSFAQGDDSQNAVSGAYSTPDPELVCIVSAGAGFLIRVADPDEYLAVGTFPILSVTPVASHRLLIFSDFCTLSAYNAEALVWKTNLCSDDLQLVTVEGSKIHCTGWNAMTQNRWEYVVDVSTGNLIHSREI